MRYFDEVGVQPNVVQEATEKQTIISMVSAGMGLALVPEWVEKLQMAGVVYRPLNFVLADPPPEALLGVCWRRHQKLKGRDHFLTYLHEFNRRGSAAEENNAVSSNVAPFPLKRSQ
ncbi:hypothetical protein HCU64_24655 [Methylobacterium sp. C25]|nr:hypothetical protein [Methylobacterium sp. C25]